MHAFHPDPGQPARWSLDNGCGRPVAILVAVCAHGAAGCAGNWVYEPDGMMLPGKAQRPVTMTQETQYGREIRFVACLVSNRAAIGLIGSDSETRTSALWAEQFAAARASDECLSRVQSWAAAGRHSGASIDQLIGTGLPQNVT